MCKKLMKKVASVTVAAIMCFVIFSQANKQGVYIGVEMNGAFPNIVCGTWGQLVMKYKYVISFFSYLIVLSSTIGYFNSDNIPIVFWLILGGIGSLLSLEKYKYIDTNKSKMLFAAYDISLFIACFCVLRLMPLNMGLFRNLIIAIIFIIYMRIIYYKFDWFSKKKQSHFAYYIF